MLTLMCYLGLLATIGVFLWALVEIAVLPRMFGALFVILSGFITALLTPSLLLYAATLGWIGWFGLLDVYAWGVVVLTPFVVGYRIFDWLRGGTSLSRLVFLTVVSIPNAYVVLHTIGWL